jgi:hypothetical protein
MHLKRKWLFISLLAAVVLLTVGIIGSAVYAQSSTSTSPANQTTFAARVARILGIEQSQVESAFTQARQEMQDEALNTRLQKMIDNGKLTQEQADQYKEWIKTRPDLPAGLGNGNEWGGRGGMGGCFPRMGGQNFNPYSTPSSSGTN